MCLIAKKQRLAFTIESTPVRVTPLEQRRTAMSAVAAEVKAIPPHSGRPLVGAEETRQSHAISAILPRYVSHFASVTLIIASITYKLN